MSDTNGMATPTPTPTPTTSSSSSLISPASVLRIPTATLSSPSSKRTFTHPSPFNAPSSTSSFGSLNSLTGEGGDSFSTSVSSSSSSSSSGLFSSFALASDNNSQSSHRSHCSTSSASDESTVNGTSLANLPPLQEAMHIVLQAVHEDSLGHYHLALPLYLLSIQHFQKAVNDSAAEPEQKAAIDEKVAEYQARVRELQQHHPFAKNVHLGPPPASLSIPLIVPLSSLTTTSFGSLNTVLSSPLTTRPQLSKRERRRTTVSDEEKLAKKKLYNKQYYQKKKTEKKQNGDDMDDSQEDGSEQLVSVSSSSPSITEDSPNSIKKRRTNSSPSIHFSPSGSSSFSLPRLTNSSPSSSSSSGSSPGSSSGSSSGSSLGSSSGFSSSSGSSNSSSSSNINSHFANDPTISLLKNLVPFVVRRVSTLNERPMEIVSLSSIVPSILISLMYAGSDNLIGRPLDGYSSNNTTVCFLTLAAAVSLQRVQQELEPLGLSLLVLDGYRPQRAVEHLYRWATTTENEENSEDEKLRKQKYYPNVLKSAMFNLGYIARRSGHSRGSTVDVTIVYRKNTSTTSSAASPSSSSSFLSGSSSTPTTFATTTSSSSSSEVLNSLSTLATAADSSIPTTLSTSSPPFFDTKEWEELDMGTKVDFMDELSWTNSTRVSGRARANRLLLKTVMDKHGFENLPQEWWHFSLRAETFPDTYFDFPVG